MSGLATSSSAGQSMSPIHRPPCLVGTHAQLEGGRSATEMICRMAGVITASDPSWITPFAGLSPRYFRKLVTKLRREGADAVRRGRPWSLPLEDRVETDGSARLTS